MFKSHQFNNVGINIYIHIPFCEKKCAYCYFYSIEKAKRKTIGQYLFWLEREFKLKSKAYNFNEKTLVDNIYIGGGTPSYLNYKELKILFAIINRHVNVGLAKEFTVELNPVSVSGQKLDFLKKQGVTRLSLGVQTLNSKSLKYLGRLPGKNLKRIILNIKKIGFSDVNLDFMYGLPFQTMKDAERNLELIKELMPTSVYLYELSIVTPAMREAAAKGLIPDANFNKKFYALSVQKLVELGYNRLMNEYFSLKKKPFAYIHDWWLTDKNIAFGPFGISKIGNEFIKNVNSLEEYQGFLQKSELPILFSHRLSLEEAAVFFLAYKIRFGSVNLDEARSFGVNAGRLFSKQIKMILSKDLAVFDGRELLLTARGFDLTPDLQRILVQNYPNVLNLVSRLLGRSGEDR